MPDEWTQSTEGDLDPDLTEEAGYGDWVATDRARWASTARVIVLLTLIAVIGGVLLAVAR